MPPQCRAYIDNAVVIDVWRDCKCRMVRCRTTNATYEMSRNENMAAPCLVRRHWLVRLLPDQQVGGFSLESYWSSVLCRSGSGEIRQDAMHTRSKQMLHVPEVLVNY